jgi:alpha-ribazole phosphatase
MEIYLIRHTTPAIGTGICYGQTDLDVAKTFQDEAELLAKCLPDSIQHIISSPLQRCRKLAGFLFPERAIELNDQLKEIHCGDWEMREWDKIPKESLDFWMQNFVSSPFPNGESYEQFHQRITNEFENVISGHNGSVAIVSHGGVMRSILSYITNTSLQDSFDRFKIPYGSVVGMIRRKGSWQQKSLM